MEEKKTEKCPQCRKPIGLIESIDYDSLCRDCYWEVVDKEN
jgi:NMD protein affecting ribosome stability and mRNA decay